MDPFAENTLETSQSCVPQTDRLGLLNRFVSITILGILTLCLSIFVMAAEPKITIVLAAFCFFAGGRRLFIPAVWPLLAIAAYDLVLAIVFPGHPSIGLVFQHPLFVVDCMLLAALALGGQSVGRQQMLVLGVLGISLIGVVGDFTGHDMISMLPLQLPDDATFDQVTMMGDTMRVRGFFPESGVLGAVCMGFATILALGGIVMICLRVRLRFAWTAVLGALVMGGGIFCLTITKTGLFMVAAGVEGFLAVMFYSRNARCRWVAAIAFLTASLVASAFVAVAPGSLGSYLRGEIIAAIHPDELGAAALASGHAGMITRYKCWELAFATLHHFPMGVGPYGLGTVVQQIGDTGLTNEMRFFFSRDNYGLKNALANLIAECGLPGLALLGYWVWSGFVTPIRRLLADGSARSTLIAGYYGAAALSCVVFLFSCELYPSLAFLLVLKFHADAIAQSCAKEPGGGLELIG